MIKMKLPRGLKLKRLKFNWKARKIYLVDLKKKVVKIFWKSAPPLEKILVRNGSCSQN